MAEREKLFGRVEELARGIETLQTEGWELESGNRRKTLPANRGGGRLQQPRYGRLDFPVYDGKNDPLVWLSRCEHYFRHQHIPESEKVEIACYHLDEDAQVWFLKLDIDRPGILWEEFKRECHRRFGAIVQGNKLRELCKLRQSGTVEEYHRKFEQLVTRAGILIAEQEVEIFVSGLQEDIGLEVYDTGKPQECVEEQGKLLEKDTMKGIYVDLVGVSQDYRKKIRKEANEEFSQYKSNVKEFDCH
ncbi:retrotransposon gag protein, partial [Tanacetum coccineum]